MRSMSDLAERYVFDYLPVFTQNLLVSAAGQRRFRNRFSDHFHETLEAWQTTIDGPVSALREVQRVRLLRLVERARKFSPFYEKLPLRRTRRTPKRRSKRPCPGFRFFRRVSTAKTQMRS